MGRLTPAGLKLEIFDIPDATTPSIGIAHSDGERILLLNGSHVLHISTRNFSVLKDVVLQHTPIFSHLSRRGIVAAFAPQGHRIYLPVDASYLPCQYCERRYATRLVALDTETGLVVGTSNVLDVYISSLLTGLWLSPDGRTAYLSPGLTSVIRYDLTSSPIAGAYQPNLTYNWHDVGFISNSRAFTVWEGQTSPPSCAVVNLTNGTTEVLIPCFDRRGGSVSITPDAKYAISLMNVAPHDPYSGADPLVLRQTDSLGDLWSARPDILKGKWLITTAAATDDAPPAFTPPPANVIAEATGPEGALVTYPLPVAVDDVDGPVAVVCSPERGTVFPLGSTTVSCSAADEAGNSATAGFAVTVRDTTPPVLGSPVVSPSVLPTPNHRLVPVVVTISATDSVDAAPVCELSAVRSNEPQNGLGDGDTSPDWTMVTGLRASLRAERSGKGDGRTYTLDVTCRDASGNRAVESATVLVPKGKK